MTEGITTSKSLKGLSGTKTLPDEEKEKPESIPTEKTEIIESTAEEAEAFETADSGMYLGYKVIEDNTVKELRLPKDVIDFLVNFANWETMQKRLGKLEEIPGKYYICTKDGFKRPKIKGTQARMFVCPRCGKPLMES